MWTQKLPGLETSPRVGGMKPATESGEVCMRDQVTSRSQPLRHGPLFPALQKLGLFSGKVDPESLQRYRHGAQWQAELKHQTGSNDSEKKP